MLSSLVITAAPQWRAARLRASPACGREIGILAQRLDALDGVADRRRITHERLGDLADVEREDDVHEVHRDLSRERRLRVAPRRRADFVERHTIGLRHQNLGHAGEERRRRQGLLHDHIRLFHEIPLMLRP